MKIGILTYESLYCNFTNYGTVLQAWALLKAVATLSDEYEPILVDYCPDIMADKDPLDPMKNMWDTDTESRKMCELSIPSIKVNFNKIRRFYSDKMRLTSRSYTSTDVNNVTDEGIFRFICGSDSIWDVTEFGMDRAFFADYLMMRKNSIAYAPSFQDSFSTYSQEQHDLLIKYLDNFAAVGIRDEEPMDFICNHTHAEVKRVVDPTLLLKSSDYDDIIATKQESERYILYYSRRYNKAMEDFVENIAAEKNLKVIEISLRYKNRDKHRMFYEAGVEEFLSLIKHSEFVVTNSFHCMIFALHFEKEFYVFTREHCNNKICELLKRLDISDRLLQTGDEERGKPLDYSRIKSRLEEERTASLAFLNKQLGNICGL